MGHRDRIAFCVGAHEGALRIRGSFGEGIDADQIEVIGRTVADQDAFVVEDTESAFF